MKGQDSEQPLSLAQYGETALRRRGWILGGLFAVWAAAWIATWVLPARYRSETTIVIDELQVAAEGNSGLQARLQTLTPQILSRSRLQQIIRDLKLYQGGSGSTEGLVSQMRRDIQVQPLAVSGRPNELAAFTVSYAASNPALAQQVTRRLTSLFIEENVRTRAQRSQQTTSFLDSQLQDARAWLQKQEARLQQFKAQYLGQLPSETQANISLREALDGRLQNATQGLQHANQQKLYLNSLLAQYRRLRISGSSASSSPAETPPALDAELSRLNQQIAVLRLRYTEAYPDLMRLREQMARTEKLKVQIEHELTGGPTAPKVEESPASLQIQSQLQATEQEIRDRQNQITDMQAEMRAVQARLRNTPLRERELAELTRDYDQSRAYYESLLAKRNQSQLAGSLEKQQQGEQFRILDPPTLPGAPYYPDRFKFSLAGLLLGLVAGGLAGYGREVMDDRIHSPAEVASLLPAPVLASIPPAAKPDSWLHRLRVGGEIAGLTALLALITGSTFLAFVARYRD
jgi:succinoglycan biosynthesis transport protein ExoP